MQRERCEAFVFVALLRRAIEQAVAAVGTRHATMLTSATRHFTDR
jgi:hypothetical protein